jgi:hypothetical protein
MEHDSRYIVGGLRPLAMAGDRRVPSLFFRDD